MKRISIVVANGHVESVFADDDIEVEVIDFDANLYDFEEQDKLANYVDELRRTKKEIIC